MPRYDSSFYKSETQYSLTSAAEIVPHVMELIAPSSVVDVGCGVGGWLAVFTEHGGGDIQGFDGDWVNPEMLRIDPSRFSPRDLRRPIVADRAYDLALCLEVAEHLPREIAPQLIESLTSLAPVVLFSAAIPHQGGTGHVNEQWQSWWADGFAKRGYVPVDCLRHLIWKNESISHWYCQNLLVYANEAALARLPGLAAARERTDPAMLDLVHPRMLTLAETSLPRLAKRALTMVPRTVRRNRDAQATHRATHA